MQKLIEVCRNIVATAKTIEYIGYEKLNEHISIYSGDSGLITIRHEENMFDFSVYHTQEETISYKIGSDLQVTEDILTALWETEFPNFAENYQKDNLRVELEKLEERRISIEKLLNGEEFAT